MTVLVTGGTGFVGREILQALPAAGHRARLLARSRETAAVRALAARCGAEVHVGNVRDAKSLAGGLRGTDAVIHLAGIISEAGEQTFENVHTHGTGNVVAAALRAGVKRFVHMSALGTRPDAASRYHQSKWAAEEIVRGSGLDWTIFRPSIIYGAGDGFVNLFARIARFSPVVPIMGSGQTRFQPIPVENVARCFVESLTEPKSIGQTCDLCGSETLTLIEIVDQILTVTGRRRWKLRVQFGVARVQAALLEFLFARLLSRPPPLNRDQLVMLQEDSVGNGQRAQELFGVEPVRFADGIARYLKRDACDRWSAVSCSAAFSKKRDKPESRSSSGDTV